jgi:hypothetical protein
MVLVSEPLAYCQLPISGQKSWQEKCQKKCVEAQDLKMRRKIENYEIEQVIDTRSISAYR